MKRIILLLLLTILAVELIHYALVPAPAAEMPAATPTPTPLQTVVITAAETPKPERMTRPQAVIYDYHVGVDSIEAVARGMWGLNTGAEKRGFAFLVVNRMMSQRVRADGKREFATGIKGIVEQPGEFFFYDPDAPASDANMEIAELYINAQLTYILTKQYTGFAFPSTMLFMSWDGKTMSFMAEPDGEPWHYAAQEQG